MKRHIGITGTRRGATKEQLDVVQAILRFRARSLDHGDCIGVDAQTHELAKKLGLTINVHPPTDERHRAFNPPFNGGVLWPAKSYLERNREIVDNTDELVAVPRLDLEEQRSGTWYTIRYALRVNRPLTIVFPSGRTESVNP